MSDNPNDITTDDARIRELMLMNLFAVFNERDPNRRLNATGKNKVDDEGIRTDPERTFIGRAGTKRTGARAARRPARFCVQAAGPVHVLRDLGHLAFIHDRLSSLPAGHGYDVALIRDGRIAVLYTLVVCVGDLLPFRGQA